MAAIVKLMKTVSRRSLRRDASIFDSKVAPVLNGGDPDGFDHVCGGCGLVLLEHLGINAEFRNVAVTCPRCGECNVPQ